MPRHSNTNLIVNFDQTAVEIERTLIDPRVLASNGYKITKNDRTYSFWRAASAYATAWKQWDRLAVPVPNTCRTIAIDETGSLAFSFNG